MNDNFNLVDTTNIQCILSSHDSINLEKAKYLIFTEVTKTVHSSKVSENNAGHILEWCTKPELLRPIIFLTCLLWFHIMSKWNAPRHTHTMPFYTHFIRHICCASLSNVKCRFISEMTHKFENNFTLTFYTLKHVTHSDKSIESPRRARIHKVAQVKIKVLVLRLDLSFSIHNTWIWGKEKSSWNKLSPVCFKNILPDCTQTSWNLTNHRV